MIKDRNGLTLSLDACVVFADKEQRDLGYLTCPGQKRNRRMYEDLIVPKIGTIREILDDGQVVVQIDELALKPFQPYELLLYPCHWNEK